MQSHISIKDKYYIQGIPHAILVYPDGTMEVIDLYKDKERLYSIVKQVVDKVIKIYISMIARIATLICLIVGFVSCEQLPPDKFVLEGQVENLKDSTVIELAYFTCLLYTSPSPRDQA